MGECVVEFKSDKVTRGAAGETAVYVGEIFPKRKAAECSVLSCLNLEQYFFLPLEFLTKPVLSDDGSAPTALVHTAPANHVLNC